MIAEWEWVWIQEAPYDLRRQEFVWLLTAAKRKNLKTQRWFQKRQYFRKRIASASD